MAKIVTISTGTYKEGLNNIGDIVAIHDDDVELGTAYKTFKVVQVQGTKEDVQKDIDSFVSAETIKAEALLTEKQVTDFKRAKYQSKLTDTSKTLTSVVGKIAYNLSTLVAIK